MSTTLSMSKRPSRTPQTATRWPSRLPVLKPRRPRICGKFRKITQQYFTARIYSNTSPKTNGWRAPKWWALEKVAPALNMAIFGMLNFWGVIPGYHCWMEERNAENKNREATWTQQRNTWNSSLEKKGLHQSNQHLALQCLLYKLILKKTWHVTLSYVFNCNKPSKKKTVPSNFVGIDSIFWGEQVAQPEPLVHLIGQRLAYSPNTHTHTSFRVWKARCPSTKQFLVVWFPVVWDSTSDEQIRKHQGIYF